MEFRIVHQPIEPARWRDRLDHPGSGGFVTFEGWVRNRNEGRPVLGLEYEIYEPIATSEGGRILREASERYGLNTAFGMHRAGRLDIGECAVWIAVSAPHRDEAFRACRYIIDEVKLRLPVWKKENYADGDSEWVNCQRCGQTAGHGDATGA